MNDREIRIEASDGKNKVIDILTDLAFKKEYVFRGYGKQEQLLPGLIRDDTKYDNIEINLLRDFERYGSHYFHANTPIDFMSYAQHFGLPTRLLDFTYNPFIALSFALYVKKSNGTYSYPDDKQYYYIRFASTKDNIILNSLPVSDKSFINITRTESLAQRASNSITFISSLFGETGIKLSSTSISELLHSNNQLKTDNIDELQQKIRNKVIFFIDPNQSNQRIIMQQGLFMFPYTLDPNKHLDIIARNSSVVMVHKDLREELLLYLDTLGYNAFRLMPDLSSICDAIRNKAVNERSKSSSLFRKKPDF